MKIVLMSGAYVNAGDFLIEQRCLRLLEKYLPKAQVDVWKRNISCEGRLEELRAYDLIVFGGGPGYQKCFWAGDGKERIYQPKAFISKGFQRV